MTLSLSYVTICTPVHIAIRKLSYATKIKISCALAINGYRIYWACHTSPILAKQIFPCAENMGFPLNQAIYIWMEEKAVWLRETTQCSHSQLLHNMITCNNNNPLDGLCLFNTIIINLLCMQLCLYAIFLWWLPHSIVQHPDSKSGNKHSKLTHIIIYDKPYANYYYNLKVKLENKQIRPFCIWCTRRTQIHVNKVNIMNS